MSPSFLKSEDANSADEDIVSPLVPYSLCKAAEYEVWMWDPGHLMISHTCSSGTILINTPRRFVKSNQKHCRL